MAEKEATVYVVDVGRQMAGKHSGRSISDLDFALQYVWDKIATTVGTGRKMANVGVVGFKTDGTGNEMYDQTQEEAYEHITVFQELQQTLMRDIRNLKSQLRSSNTSEGDAISALIIAISMIERKCKKLKYIRRIILVTDGRSPMETSDLEPIIRKIKEEGIELVILGVDFDDLEYGFKEEDKPELKAGNENDLKALAEACDGAYGTLEEAVTELSIPRPKKPPRPINLFKGGQLMLGSPAQYDTALSINVERYFRTYEARAPTASAYVPAAAPRPDEEGKAAEEAQGEPAQLTAVRSNRTYRIDNEEAPGGKQDVQREDLAMGYEYGRTAVPIDQADENITKLDTSIGLEIMGFISQDKYDRYMSMSNSYMVVGSKLSEADNLALSSVIHALADLQCMAIGRLVPKDGKPPVIVVLAPYIEPDFECLTEVQVPFAEDVRTYRFPPLDKIVTISGKEIKEHRNLPNKDLLGAMEEFVEGMELSAVDEDGERVEMLPMDEYFSPVVHRIQQAIRARAIDANSGIPELPEAIQRLKRQPEELREQNQELLKKLIKAADVKKVPPKAKGRKRDREVEKPLSGLDIEGLLSKRQKTIDPKNAIPEFKRLVHTAKGKDDFQTAAKQLADVIENRIKTSFGDQNYERAIEELGAMREELIDFDEPSIYNEIIEGLRKKIVAEELNGDRMEMLYLIRKGKLGPIDRFESEMPGAMTREEVNKWYANVA